MRLADLELDLDVFAGPFDLLLTLILREEIDLREVDLAEIVISYIDHLETRGELLRMPEPLEIRHMVAPRVTVAERLAHLRRLLRQGSFNFEQAVAGEDRVTIAVTLFALLELYKQGELTWSQEEPFGEITIDAAAPFVAVERLSA